MKGLHKVTFVLLVIGGLNWGLMLLGWDVGTFLPASLTKLIYVLVALSAVIEIFTHKNNCKHCETVKPMNGGMGQM